MYYVTDCQVTHLDGHEVVVERRGVTQPFQTHRIQGEGMPVHNQGSETGDLLIRIIVDFPAKLTDQQRQDLTSTLSG